MTQSSRLHDLSKAITKYGEVSIDLMHTVKRIGNSVIAALPDFLGDDARVLGVTPDGDDWRPTDYRDAKFSFYGIGTLEVGPIEMGVAIRIPHIKDNGSLWTRVVIEFALEGGELTVIVGDGPSIRGIEENFSDGDIQRICELIYNYLLSLFADPVAVATAAGKGKIGFVQG